MKQIRRQNVMEQSIYWVIWAIIYLTPLLGNYFVGKQVSEQTMSWHIISRTWIKVLPFFLVFLVNNYLLMPILFIEKRYKLYSACVTALIIGLCLINIPLHNNMRDRFRDNFPEMMRDNKSMARPDSMQQIMGGPERPNEPMQENMGEGGPDGITDQHGPRPNELQPGAKNSELSNPGQHNMQQGRLDMRSGQQNIQPDRPKDFRKLDRVMPIMERITKILIWFFISVMMIGLNIAIKLLFQSFRNEARMEELEKEKLSSELQYLKYQLNPHFFMNTLNNIHALVDIDTEKAKSSIIELSKLMRYVLYEANNRTISIGKEIVFLDNYITLMRLRFTDKVHITTDFPQETPDIKIPPLLFVSFLENAFKHGISYQNESYINVKVNIDNSARKIIFFCSNTTFGKEGDGHHGIGLENTRKRLDLLYGEKYTLSINDNKEKNLFEVLLLIPL